MDKKVTFFLGANSPSGFYSLYDQMLPTPQAQRIFLLKGGAGCGKSSLMRRVGAALEKAGEKAEYIVCSGDPGSLDAVIFPGLKAAIVDATAPHGAVSKRHTQTKPRHSCTHYKTLKLNTSLRPNFPLHILG